MNIERARFARICVEVDLKKPLKGTIMMNCERYFVSYEGLSSVCSGCGVYGHLVHSCPRRVQENDVGLTARKEAELAQKNMPTADGFTEVRRRARGQTSPKTTQTTGGSSRDSERNLREITIPNIRNVDISNRFADLESADTVSDEREENISLADNKENVIVSFQARKEKGVQAIKESLPGRAASGIKGPHDGPKERPAHQKKPLGTMERTKYAKQGRPVRGLVFGPTAIERPSLTSGKRLRVETTGVGRPGGVFMRDGGEQVTVLPIMSSERELTDMSRGKPGDLMESYDEMRRGDLSLKKTSECEA
ncbi:uncharacterized protein LOC111829041 [Capsella rubella]|uniref:uncharacterized protein LOC111829041 n=1 Tax=Capsella rubella TaxID=81985 RepID=UPI000CD4FAC8|nr:uncharacterized protein LOC111829041 [Capsella rubella]